MPVLKVYDMSTIEEVKETSRLVIQRQESEKYSDYNPSNIMLVRTTSIFPENGVLQTLANSTFIGTDENFITSSLCNNLDYETLKKLETYRPYYRSTIHFTENGLVSSHLYGNFDNQKYIILEPLLEQIGKSDIRNFAGQDTFIKGSVNLSKKAILIIKAEDYEYIRQTNPEIEEYNVVLYNGVPETVKNEYIEASGSDLANYDTNDQRAIVERVLIDLGYVPELIGSHYIINSPTSDKIREVNDSLSEQYGVLSEAKHVYTQEHEEDSNKNIILKNIFDKLLIDFIIQINNIDINSIVENNKITQSTVIKLVQLLGLEKIINNVEIFNETIKQMQNLNMLPTSEEIINQNIPNIYEFYIQNNYKSITK